MTERFDPDPQADRIIKAAGGIIGIEDSYPAGVRFRLADGSFLRLWEGGYDVARSWEYEKAPDA